MCLPAPLASRKPKQSKQSYKLETNFLLITNLASMSLDLAVVGWCCIPYPTGSARWWGPLISYTQHEMKNASPAALYCCTSRSFRQCRERKLFIWPSRDITRKGTSATATGTCARVHVAMFASSGNQSPIYHYTRRRHRHKALSERVGARLLRQQE